MARPSERAEPGIRVLVAEDSRTARELLVAVLRADPEIRLVGEAADGADALAKVRALRPDVVTMDVNMPVLDGLGATKQIMIEAPTPIVIVSGTVSSDEVAVSMAALRAGALAVLPKLPAPGTERFDVDAAELVRTVKLMSQVKVVRHHAPQRRRSDPVRPAARGGDGPRRVRPRAIAIAASTGGPAALARLLGDLPRPLAAPVLVVQHIAPGFVRGLAGWLATSTGHDVAVAPDGAPLEAGRILIAPDERHLGLRGGRIALSSAPPVGGFRPSATWLFRSVAAELGGAAVAVILTGMGEDGVAGLKDVRAAGGSVFAQDERTSVVYGMPLAAAAAGVVDETLPLPAIGARIAELLA
jgi:two-component system chemotaxis response regulator CheB